MTRSRLTTWKEVAAYLGRDERTVKRWEATRALPIRRMPGGRSTVFAEVADLDAWLAAAPPDVPVEAEVEPPTPAAVPPSPPSTAPSRRRWPVMAGVATVATLLALAAAVLVPRHAAPVALARPPDLYLKGVYAWNTRTRAGLDEAIADFARVIVDRPDYAPAYAGLADCYNLMPEYGGMTPAQAYPQAKVAAARAVALDPTLAGAHRSLAFVDFWWTHDAAAATREFATAARLDPRAADTHHWFANTLAMAGDFPRAIVEIDIAEQLDPASTAIRVDRANLLHSAGRTAEAVDILRTVAAARPDYASTHFVLSTIAFAEGRPEVAVDEMALAAGADGDAQSVAAAARDGYRRGGRAGLATAMRTREDALFAAGRYSPYALARSYAAVDAGRALALLDLSIARGESAIMGLRLDPRLRPLHGDPRFAALVARLHLPPVAAAT